MSAWIPSVRPSSSPWPRRRRSSSFGMPGAFRSFGQAPSGSWCQAAKGIWEHSLKFNDSSSGEWLNASTKSAAPSAPFVSLLKHLQCFVRINLSKTRWNSDKRRYQIHHLKLNNLQQRQIKEPSTISLCEARCEICLLQVEPLLHYELFATLLPGSENTRKDPTLPAAASGSTLEANLRLHLLLGCLCWSTCSVLSASNCWKDVGTRRQAGARYPIHLKPIQINSNSYDIIPQLHKPIQIWPRDNFRQRQINTRRKKENLQPFLSAGRKNWNLPSSSWSHLALRTFCHAPAGISITLPRKF